jgi:UDP-xylose/UDP-N-acetylglucosamine transporter B4
MLDWTHEMRHRNALSLEQLTSAQPKSGTLLTFLQFALVTLTTLPNIISYPNVNQGFLPRIQPRQIPILVYLGQVALFYVLSRLNNAAFAYDVPMSVHIVFRSGGVVVSLLLGWILLGRR